MPRIAVMWHRFGPYHAARLGAAARRLAVIGIEISGVDHTYPWAPCEVPPGLSGHEVLFTHERVEHRSVRELEARVAACLARWQPDVAAVPGWSDRTALALLKRCMMEGIPTILMSDSTVNDAIRRRPVEAIKSHLIRNFTAAFVAGRPQADYLVRLGFPLHRISLGYDVVDNAFFAERADALRRTAQGRGDSRRPACPYFLASARFVARKNHLNLLRAYSSYRIAAGDEAWALVILGDGELREEMSRLCMTLGVERHVHMPGFVQYEDLPAWYAYASCFIHPSRTEQWGLVVNEAMAAGLPVLVSRTCGCAEDLVRDGYNGFLFDPNDIDQLSSLLQRMSRDGVNRQAMGDRGRAIVSRWGLERFTEGLLAATAAALGQTPRRLSLLDRVLLEASLYR
jgi:1,2-diacylglycerol 3-alpha-glucosyltransferase